MITATGNRIWRRQVAGVATVKIYENTQVHRVAYKHRDALGSLTAITDHYGQVEVQLSYDAFGVKRPAGDWRDGVGIPWSVRNALYQWSHEGFTGHESVDTAGIIHMGGRIYDPHLGRFLQADPFVQFPESSQGLNRYTYVLNNPLRFTDPSGYAIDTRGWLSIAVGIASGGLAIGAESFYAAFAWATGGGFVSGYIAIQMVGVQAQPTQPTLPIG